MKTQNTKTYNMYIIELIKFTMKQTRPTMHQEVSAICCRKVVFRENNRWLKTALFIVMLHNVDLNPDIEH